MTLTTDRYLDEVVLHTTALAEAVRRAGPTGPVPSCPEWTVRDLAGHIGGVHRWAAETVGRPGERLVRRGETDPPMPEGPGREDEVSTWLLAGAATLTQAIRDAGPDTVVGGFGGPVPVSFWARRQCHETLVHRIDAEIAAGAPALGDVDPVIAADGVDEHVAMVLMGAKRRPGLRAGGRTLHLHATDTEGEWVITLDDAGPHVEHGHVKADAALRGPAAGLLAVITSRLDPATAGVELLGDPAPLDLWRDHGGV